MDESEYRVYLLQDKSVLRIALFNAYLSLSGNLVIPETVVTKWLSTNRDPVDDYSTCNWQLRAFRKNRRSELETCDVHTRSAHIYGAHPVFRIR